MSPLPIRPIATLLAILVATSAIAQEATPPPAVPVEPVEAVPLSPPPAREFVGMATVLDSRTVR